MRVLLLGGTGAMGDHLARLLHGNGCQVTVTSRRRTGTAGGITYVGGNARDEAFVRPLLTERWDCVVDFMVYSTEQFAARAEMFLASTSQYVFLSTARVFAGSATPIHEQSPRLVDVSTDSAYLATDEYALSKAREENILFQSKSDNWTIIRPYITYSESRLQLGHLEKEHWLYRALKGRTIVFSGDVRDRVTTLTHGLDVARGIAALIGQDRARRQAFNIAVPETVRWSDVLDLYLEVIEDRVGFRPEVLFQDLESSCAWYPSVQQIVYDRVYDRVFDVTKISEFIDVGTFEPPLDGLRASLEACLARPRFLDLDWRAEARKDKATREFTAFPEIAGLKDKIKYSLYRL